MRVTRLTLHNIRRFQAVELAPAPGLNLLVGANGAGKTTVLEALHLMAYGRSFRGRVRDGLVREHAPALEVFVEWAQEATGVERTHRAGLRLSGQDWSGRLDGEDVAHLGQLCAALAVVTPVAEVKSLAFSKPVDGGADVTPTLSKAPRELLAPTPKRPVLSP